MPTMVLDKPSIVNQMKHFGIPHAFGGKQIIQTPDGYNIPLSIRNGLPYMDMKDPTKEEIEYLLPTCPIYYRSTMEPLTIWTKNTLLTTLISSHPMDLPTTIIPSITLVKLFLFMLSNTHQLQPFTPDDLLNPPIKRKLLFNQVQHKQLDFMSLQPNFNDVQLIVSGKSSPIPQNMPVWKVDTRDPRHKHYKPASQLQTFIV